MNILKSLGYLIKTDKGYFEIFVDDCLLGYTKYSPRYINSFIEHISRRGQANYTEIRQKFYQDMRDNQIVYLGDEGTRRLLRQINRRYVDRKSAKQFSYVPRVVREK